MTFTSLSTILERKEYLAKMNNLPNYHRAGLHRLKAGPVYTTSKHLT